MKKTIPLLLFLFIIYSCKKEDKLSEIPEIEFISLTPSSTKEFENSIKLTISYKDGDGNLGEYDPDIYSIQVTDSRLPEPDEYHLQPLSPPDQTIQIQGEINLNLAGLFVLGSDSTESTSFKVRIKDRAGNWSNEVSTSSITVYK